LEGQSHKRLVQLKEIQLNRGLVLGYSPTSYDRLEEGAPLMEGDETQLERGLLRVPNIV
jgi:hypothetical protein